MQSHHPSIPSLSKRFYLFIYFYFYFFIIGKNTRPWYSIKESKDIIYNQPINGIYQASAYANSFGNPFSEHQSTKIHGHRKA